ncbi:MAG: CDP-alcohol phosphatidyltransferase family protein [Bacteroidaceae bacterium]|nr:CDP-alcohol phosphatidyltransferase family protein [Bacteroidaceae bacterium]
MEQDVASTYKSQDTEEWLDVVFTRPIGYRWALLFKHFGVHPNTVTVLSMILGAAAGVLFYFDADTPRGVALNVCGVLLLIWANFYDSADGQLARMTGQKTPLGRILDGASSDVWFIPIYFFISLRLYDKVMPLAATQTWGLWSFVLSAVAGFGAHTYECQLADYYRNIHLYFLKGQAGSEFDHYEQQREKLRTMPWRGHLIEKVFQWFYVNYTHTQELATPQFQRFWRNLKRVYGDDVPQSLRDRFRQRSLPLMKWANILTFNTRAIVLYISCLIDKPWIFPVFELTVLLVIYLFMRHEHESFSRAFADELEDLRIDRL